MTRVGARLREIREFRGVSEKFVADCVHLSGATISRYESGERGFEAEFIYDLADALRVDPTEFLKPVGSAIGAQNVAPSPASRDLTPGELYAVTLAESQMAPETLRVLVDFMEWRKAHGA